eukprot:TRINITY_DN19088_c0_g1_i1.p1 TRINITY_DN19088_c0_g1~~TRINITY_DN19088_c0_g1_i1.p1  ORF type:complete len:270 (+),score=53.99 TRINITY_DN19088_c0_g1_i1:375-1184(+)
MERLLAFVFQDFARGETIALNSLVAQLQEALSRAERAPCRRCGLPPNATVAQAENSTMLSRRAEASPTAAYATNTRAFSPTSAEVVGEPQQANALWEARSAQLMAQCAEKDRLLEDIRNEAEELRRTRTEEQSRNAVLVCENLLLKQRVEQQALQLGDQNQVVDLLHRMESDIATLAEEIRPGNSSSERELQRRDAETARLRDELGSLHRRMAAVSELFLHFPLSLDDLEVLLLESEEWRKGGGVDAVQQRVRQRKYELDLQKYQHSVS